MGSLKKEVSVAGAQRSMSQQITSNSSLLKYESPVIICDNNVEKAIKESNKKASNKQQQKQTAKAACLPVPKNGHLEPIQTQKPEDILPKILPPLVFEQNGQLWLQKVCATPATNLDVQRLGIQLDKRLLMANAKDTEMGTSLPGLLVKTSATWKGWERNLSIFLALATLSLSSSDNSSIPRIAMMSWRDL